MRMSLLGVLPFNAPYLPWVLLLFSLFIGNPIETDLLGMLVGHLYFFLDEIYPQVARVRGWRWQKLIGAPALLKLLCGEEVRVDGPQPNNMPLNGVRVRCDYFNRFVSSAVE